MMGLRRDWKLKLASLAVALLVWAWRTAEGNPLEERRLGPLRVEPVNLAKGLVVVGEPLAVEVTVRGPRRTLDRLAVSGELRPRVDCMAVERPSWPVLPVLAEVPETVRVVRLEPAEWEVEIDTAEVDVRPVRAELSGSTPPPGYLYAAPTLSHAQAQVSGPRALVGRVAYLAAPVEQGGRVVDFTAQARLRPIDALGQTVAGVSCEPRVVTVSVRVGKPTAERRLPVIARFGGAGSAPAGYRVEPDAVTVRGEASGLGQLGPLVSTLPVPLPLPEGGTTVGLALPDGVAAEPARVRVRPASGGR